MGGCRCTFRNCKVNTYNSPGMHFFRFPLKDKARCDLWIKYTQLFDLYNMPLVRQKNVTICGRHFRDESFMNYKKDRLVATAVPSVHRLSIDKALDYELEINRGKLVTLPEMEKVHLIAPPGFQCPLGFDAEASELLRSVENERNTENIFDNGVNSEPLRLLVESNSNLTTTDSAQIMERLDIQTVRTGMKRTASCLLTEETTSDEGNGQMTIVQRKMSRNDNRTKDEGAPISADTIVLSESSETEGQPTIINHQIMDAGGRLWLPSDTFSLQDSAEYQFVEIQQQSDQSETEQIKQVPEQVLEENIEGGNLAVTDEVHLSHMLDDACIEIDDLSTKLKKELGKVKKLESKLSACRVSYTRAEQQVTSLKVDITDLKNANEELHAKYMEMDILKLQLEHDKEERSNLEKELSTTKQEHTRTKNNMVILKKLLAKAKSENDELKKEMLNNHMLIEKETVSKQEYEQQLQSQRADHLKIEQQLRQQITALEQSLEFTREQLTETRSTLSSIQTECTHIKSDKLNSVQKVLVIESQLQELQKQYDDKTEQHTQMEHSFESLQKSNEKLEADYKMLENNQNQVSTVTTSHSTSNVATPVIPQQQPATPALSKAQLFNGIKRYISSSMCSLLRMEMFGSSERDWKPDERQVAVDLLRLGEFVYKYLTDEWRFRLPALRDVRNWLSQSVAMDDEEDL